MFVHTNSLSIRVTCPGARIVYVDLLRVGTTLGDVTGQLYAKIHLCRERRRSLVKDYLDMLIPSCPKITIGLATKSSSKGDPKRIETFEQKLKAAECHVEALWMRFKERQKEMRRNMDTEWNRSHNFVKLNTCKQNKDLDHNRIKVTEAPFANQSGNNENTRLLGVDRIKELKRKLEETRQDLNCLKREDTSSVTGSRFVSPKWDQQSTESKLEESKDQPDTSQRSCFTRCQRNTSVKTSSQVIDHVTMLSCEEPFAVMQEMPSPLMNKNRTDKSSENILLKNQTIVQLRVITPETECTPTERTLKLSKSPSSIQSPGLYTHMRQIQEFSQNLSETTSQNSDTTLPNVVNNKLTEYEEYLLKAVSLGSDAIYSSGEQTDELEFGEAIEQRKPTHERGAVSNPVPSDSSQLPSMQNITSVPSAQQKNDSDEDSFYD
ncbi:hypothetical protein EG68_07118 [Paragonimus skrjabini miyazakii]|uniref:Uncharacterized protein n=1 Tax=Paragonimus skrjabini miyazakii TaxID=59628 RepID=A0A8S9YFZ5_9TREM|nr:hypothetical protein EG68_07118 [Paragonimus skrjabini miyazakii]